NLRKKRFALFKELISSLPRPICILDVGGTEEFWEQMDFIKDDVKIIVYNRSRVEVTHSNIISMAGDARNVVEFQDNEFDIVFSNAVIEHVGSFAHQLQMAEEE